MTALANRIGELELQQSRPNAMGGRFDRATDLPAEMIPIEVTEAAAQKAAEIQYYKEVFQILGGFDNMKQGKFGVK